MSTRRPSCLHADTSAAGAACVACAQRERSTLNTVGVQNVSLQVLNPEKLSSSAENLLVLKEGKWARHALCPQADDKTKYNHEEQPEMTPDELSYLTYLNLYIAKENVSEENMAKTIMGKGNKRPC